jgi:transposase
MNNPAVTTIGLAIGEKFSEYFVLAPDGECLGVQLFATDVEVFKSRFKVLDRAQVILEVTPHSAWVIGLLDDFGFEVVIADPRHVKLIREKYTRSRQSDAERLARLGHYLAAHEKIDAVDLDEIFAD